MRRSSSATAWIPRTSGPGTRAWKASCGVAETADDVVNFYDVIFNAHFSSQDRADLAAFLRSL
jgi:hypothetical protein